MLSLTTTLLLFHPLLLPEQSTMSQANKKTKPLIKHKRNPNRINLPPGIIHVYQSVRNPVKREVFCFDTDNFNLLLF